MPSTTATTAPGRLAKNADTIGSSMVGDAMTVIHLHTGRFSTLDGSALRIWELLDQTDDLAAICATLETEYDVEPRQCREEVDRFAEELVAAGIARYV